MLDDAGAFGGGRITGEKREVEFVGESGGIGGVLLDESGNATVAFLDLGVERLGIEQVKGLRH